MAQHYSLLPRRGRGKILLDLLEKDRERERKEQERKEEIEKELERQRKEMAPNDKQTQTGEQTYKPTGIIRPDDHLRRN